MIGLHDESAIYANETAELTRVEARPVAREQMNRVAMAASFKAVTLERVEVIFIVIATGVGGLLIPAAVDALLAGVTVVFVWHRPSAAARARARDHAQVRRGCPPIGLWRVLAWRRTRVPLPGKALTLLGLTGAFAIISLLVVAALRRRTVSPEFARRAGAAS